MINKEYLMIIAMGGGGILGAIGGTGFKPARRFILPVLLGAVALLAGFIWWKCLVMAILMMGAFSLPYGERTPYWLKFLVGCAFVAPTLLLGFSVWQIITPAVFITLFWVSNTKWGRTTIFWKAWEFIIFACVGICVSSFIK